MRENVVSDRRTSLFKAVLTKAKEFGAIGQVMISDPTKRLATTQAKNPEMDVLIMALERFDYSLSGDERGIVIVARPSGGRTDEDAFLRVCEEVVQAGTEYSAFKRLATNILTMPFTNSRILQVSDLVVSATTAIVAGHKEYAEQVFPEIRSLLRSELGRVGGVGVKIHPDYSYVNLYHWLFGDDVTWRRNMGTGLPIPGRPYATGPSTY